MATRDQGPLWAPSEVAEGIVCHPLRSPTLPPATHTNAYLVGGCEAVLVEPASPYPDEVLRMTRWLDDERARGRRPVAVVLTHHHVDHIGGARAAVQHLGVPLLCHRETARRLPRDLIVDHFLEDGERLELGGGAHEATLRVLHTPGHAPGHVCLHDERTGVLVAGDMVAGEGTILVEPQDGDMGEYFASLARLRDLSPTVVLPAHGPPQPAQVLAKTLAHRMERERLVLVALRALGRWAAADDLVAAVYSDVPRDVWPLAVMSLEAHLLKLSSDGLAERGHGRFRALT